MNLQIFVTKLFLILSFERLLWLILTNHKGKFFIVGIQNKPIKHFYQCSLLLFSLDVD